MLTETTGVPPGLLDASARDLERLLGGPTLLHLPGRRTPPLFISTLLHGNEDTGLVAVQALLRHWQGRHLPRALSVFIGNVRAARAGLRREDAQPDFNRVWPGTRSHLDTPEHRAMCAVTERMRERGCFASIDIHNNTGLNPHYSVVVSPDARSLRLAALFGRIVTWFRGLHGSQTGAFAPFCPAIAVECGKPGTPANAERAYGFLDAALHLSELPDSAPAEGEIDLYHTAAIVTVAGDIEPAFGDRGAALSFPADFDRMNFCELPPGFEFACTRLAVALAAHDEHGADVTADFFERRGDALLLRRAAIPAMITLDTRVVRQDCLCYLMERVSRDRLRAAVPGDGGG
ncbi:MAG: M14 family metallopeptidase [Gammaproteobacteria bacterium]